MGVCALIYFQFFPIPPFINAHEIIVQIIKSNSSCVSCVICPHQIIPVQYMHSSVLRTGNSIEWCVGVYDTPIEHQLLFDAQSIEHDFLICTSASVVHMNVFVHDVTKWLDMWKT